MNIYIIVYSPNVRNRCLPKEQKYGEIEEKV